MKLVKIILVALLSLSLLFMTTACSCGDNNEPIIEHSFSINKTNVELEIGQTFDIVAAYGDETIIYTVDKTDIATVDQTGKVTAIKEGVAYVTVSAGEITRICKITVIKAEYTVRLYSGDVIMTVGTNKKLEAITERGGKAYNGSVSWKTTGGTLNSNGLIAWFTASVKGEYTITVKSDKGATATYKIIVVEQLDDLV